MDQFVTKLILGFFAASKLDWVSIEEDLRNRGYTVVKESAKKEDTYKPNAYQAKRYEKTYEDAFTFSIDLEIRSLSEEEITSYVPHYNEKKDCIFVGGDRVISWLNERKGVNAFYYFVKFEINCYISRDKIAGTARQKLFEIKSFFAESLERIAQQEVYFDFRESIMRLQFATKTESTIEINEKTKDEIKTGTNKAFEETIFLSKVSTEYVSPFAYFLQKNRVEFEVTNSTPPGKFTLGKKIRLSITPRQLQSKANANIKLEHSTEGPTFCTVSPRFRLLVNSQYFDFNPAFCNVVQNKTYDVLISPIVEKITAEKKDEKGYPIILTLVDTLYGVVYPTYKFYIKLDLPKLNIDINRRNWLHKGWSTEVLVEIDGSKVDVDIPVTVRGKVGPDFVVTNPPPEDETKKTNIQNLIQVKHGDPQNVGNFTLKAQRAGIWPFKNEAFFQFSIGSWNYKMEQRTLLGVKSVLTNKKLDVKSDYWKMSMHVFPSWFDIFVAGFAGLYLLAMYYYPFLVPSITKGLDATTLALPSSAIYLAYRVINWGRTLQSEFK